MARLVVVALGAIGLILFVAFIVSRLLATRTRSMSLRMQVFLALALIVGTFAFGLGLLVIDRIEARVVRLATQAASDEASALAGLFAGEIDRSKISVVRIAERLETERRRGADLRLLLLDAEGRVLFPEGRAITEPRSVSVDAPIRVDGKKVGAVRVIKPTIVMARLLADFAPTVLIISLVLGAAAALAAAWIGRAVAAPIEAMSRYAERMSGGERSAAPPVTFGRELIRLRTSIEAMRRQLEGRPFVETFAADLSHELKNPVAAIRASAEVLDDGAIDEPEKARHFVTRIREAGLRIERLLNELLSLAKIEARGTERFEPVNLEPLVQKQVESFADASKRITLDVAVGGSVRGDPTWLGRAVFNLLDNALVHSEPESRVAVSLATAEGDAVLEVRNAGSIRPNVREQLFHRFVTTRVDKGGTGLGLAIVRAVAEAHGGQVEIVEAGPPDVRFRLRLPLG
jgi:two-component system, OmpR family, sensor histidine kinase CreC